MRDPDKDTSRREFVETVDDVTMANDMVKHIQEHSPPNDHTFQQWGTRPYNVTREFDRSRWVEKQAEWSDPPTPGKPLVIE
jgi:hypothetical protein